MNCYNKNGICFPKNKVTKKLWRLNEKCLDFFESLGMLGIMLLLLTTFFIFFINACIYFGTIVFRGLKYSCKYIPASFVVLLLLGSNVYLICERLGKAPDASILLAQPAKAAIYNNNYSYKIVSLRDSISSLKNQLKIQNELKSSLTATNNSLAETNKIQRLRIDSLNNEIASLKNSLNKSSSNTGIKVIKQQAHYVNNTPVWISLSPNAYAYHRTYRCAANRTKYKVIEVTTTEAREKYYRSPCGICHPK